MATLMIISSSTIVTKTMRDNQEAAKLVSEIEYAKTERLRVDINCNQGVVVLMMVTVCPAIHLA